MTPEQVLTRRLQRAQRKVAVLEAMIEDKTRELFLSNAKLSELHRVMPGAVVVMQPDGSIDQVNDSALELLGYSRDELLGMKLQQLRQGLQVPESEGVVRVEESWRAADGTVLPVLVSFAALAEYRVCVAVDLRERKQLEVDLRHAHKMEAIGQLAAGVAHEINTPMQFIGDNVAFLQEAVEDLLAYATQAESLVQPPLRAKLDAAAKQADLGYLREHGLAAAHSALQGISRVRSIVKALKAFAHPNNSPAPTKLNDAIRNTVKVAESEYRLVADLQLDLFDELPDVTCCVGDINQVLLNLVVNAAHAIEDRVGASGGRGKISVRTRVGAESCVVIEIEDTGCGIPAAVAHRIFEPFFTTKGVGRGSGQGLSLAHAIVVERHGGRLDFETAAGVGTTFRITLPIDGAKQLAA